MRRSFCCSIVFVTFWSATAGAVHVSAGTLIVLLSGEPIVSLEGHRYAGLPVIGHTLTTLRTRFENGVTLERALSCSCARPMPARTDISID